MRTEENSARVEAVRPSLDQAPRQETKFVFPRADLGKLRTILRRTCRPIEYAGPVSTVYSVYFDDPVLGTCMANLDGIGLRHKTRVRWYDSERPEGTCYFETKWRRHRAVGKERTPFSADLFGEDAVFRTFHRRLLAALPVERRGYLAHDNEPVTLVRYRREHFALDGTTARLTLDYDIRFFPLLGRRRLKTRFGVDAGNVALIECKTAFGDSGALEGALGPLRARPDRFSKYVTACQRLGYAPEI